MDTDSCVDKGEKLGRTGGVGNDVFQSMCFIVITDQSYNPLGRFQESSRSNIWKVLDKERAMP